MPRPFPELLILHQNDRLFILDLLQLILADWSKIGEEVARQTSPWRDIKTRPTLDRMVEKLTSATAQAVDRFTPDMRPTTYSKRWFTPDLKVQQVEVNQLRRRWQASCAELGRDHANTTAAFQAMQ